MLAMVVLLAGTAIVIRRSGSRPEELVAAAAPTARAPRFLPTWVPKGLSLVHVMENVAGPPSLRSVRIFTGPTGVKVSVMRVLDAGIAGRSADDRLVAVRGIRAYWSVSRQSLMWVDGATFVASFNGVDSATAIGLAEKLRWTGTVLQLDVEGYTAQDDPSPAWQREEVPRLVLSYEAPKSVRWLLVDVSTRPRTLAKLEDIGPGTKRRAASGEYLFGGGDTLSAFAFRGPALVGVFAYPSSKPSAEAELVRVLDSIRPGTDAALSAAFGTASALIAAKPVREQTSFEGNTIEARGGPDRLWGFCLIERGVRNCRAAVGVLAGQLHAAFLRPDGSWWVVRAPLVAAPAGSMRVTAVPAAERSVLLPAAAGDSQPMHVLKPAR